MTEKDYRNLPVDFLKKYVGIKEWSNEHIEILKIFNDSGLCSRYLMTENDPWCATGVSSAFIATKLTKIFPCVECSCNEMIKLAKENGIWQEKDDYIPDIGDAVMYNWDDNGIGDNVGIPNHVGLITERKNNIFESIECNIKNTVGYRTMIVNSRYIRGFITPNYKSLVEEAIKEKTTLEKNVLYNGVVNIKDVPGNYLAVRKWAGVEYAECSFSPLHRNDVVGVCDQLKSANGDLWYYIKYNNLYGFVKANYII